MGKNIKKVRKAFPYLDYGAFSAYLEKMAARGWHFKEWRGRLIFERGEPEQATYSVEVFGNANEDDERPNPDTLEFAEYCEAAGWKLMATKRKFCIFKKCREDATDILTAQERIDSAADAAKRFAFKCSLTPLLLLAMNLAVMALALLVYSQYPILLNHEVISYRGAAILLFLIIICWVDVAFITLWQRRQTKRLAKEGVTTTKRSATALSSLFEAIALIVLLFIPIGAKDPVPPDYLRPTLEAVSQEDGQFTMIGGCDHETGILGTTTECSFGNLKDSHLVVLSAGGTVKGLKYDCTIYETKHNWILDKIWAGWVEKGGRNAEPLDLKTVAAEEAFRFDEMILIRFEDAILILEETRSNFTVSED